MTGTLEITWPIDDPTVPLAHLKADALDDLRGTLRMYRTRAITGPIWSITHGRQAALHVSLQVQS